MNTEKPKLDLHLSVVEDTELSHAVAYELSYESEDKPLAQLLEQESKRGINSGADKDNSGNSPASET